VERERALNQVPTFRDLFRLEGCTIRHGAYIRGNCIAWGVVIGHATEVKRHFSSQARMPHDFAYAATRPKHRVKSGGRRVKPVNVRSTKEIVIHHEGVTSHGTAQMGRF